MIKIQIVVTSQCFSNAKLEIPHKLYEDTALKKCQWKIYMSNFIFLFKNIKKKMLEKSSWKR